MLKQVSDTQLFVLASFPTMITVLIGILINNARLSDLKNHIEACFDGVDRRFDRLGQRFDSLDRRFEQTLESKPRRREEL